MTNREMLTAYRTAVIELEELKAALARTGGSGLPMAMRTAQLDRLPGTNDPAAAALQAAEGIQERMERKRSELALLAAPVAALMAAIGDWRTFMVIRGYYLNAESDSTIAENLCMSRCRVNQIRNQYLAQAS